MKNNEKKLLLGIILLLTIFVVFLSVQKLNVYTKFCPEKINWTDRGDPETTMRVLEESIERIMEVTTASYEFNVKYSRTQPNMINNKWNFDFKIGEKSYTFLINGTVKAGFVVNDKNILKMDEKEKRLIFTFPNPQIISSVSDDQITVLDERDTYFVIFNNTDSEDYKSEVAIFKRMIEERAIQQGLYDEAKKSLEEYVNAYVNLINTSLQLEYKPTIEYREESDAANPAQ